MGARLVTALSLAGGRHDGDRDDLRDRLRPEQTIWCCLAFDRDKHHARYLRVTPERRIAFVDVRCRAEGTETVAQVSYRYHALTEVGRTEVAAMRVDDFAAEIDGWQDLIREHRSRAGQPPAS